MADDPILSAQDYETWLAKTMDNKAKLIADMRKETEDLQAQNQELATKKNAFDMEILKTKESMGPLRDELHALEDSINALKKQKAQESETERASFDAHQRIIADQTARLTALDGELTKRKFSLEDRERAASDALVAADTQKSAVVADRLVLEQDRAEFNDREATAIAKARLINDKEQEVMKRLAEAEAREEAAITSEARARDDRILNEDMTTKIASDLNEVKNQKEALQQTKDEINSLLPVLKQFYDYVKTHVHDPDGIAAVFKTLFPLAMDANNQGSL